MTRVVVIGHGMVGARFAEELVAADPGVRVTVLGREPVPAYNRVLLSSVVAGSTSANALGLAGPPHERITVLTGTSAREIDTDACEVVDDRDRRYGYDHLVLATGSAARIPPIQGIAIGAGLVPGVFVLKDLADAQGIVAATPRARNAVVLGAGVLGIEVATGLVKRGLSVTLVHRHGRLMERQLGWEASQVARSSLDRLGVTARTGAGVVGVSTRRGRLDRIRLDDGSELAADLFVVCTGTTPETSLARSAGLACDRGVLVDDTLTTADPRIHAIGDCAQPPEGATGLVAQGWAQARRLVDHLCAATPQDAAAREGNEDVVRVKADGMSMVTMGVAGEFDREDPRYRVLSMKDPAGGRFVEIVVAGGILVGATCIGDAEVGAALSARYSRGMPIPEDPSLLLVRSLAVGGAETARRAPADLADDDRVCTCNSVSAGAIRTAIRSGCDSTAEIAACTRAGTGCGDCRSVVEGLLAATPATQPAPPPSSPGDTVLMRSAP